VKAPVRTLSRLAVVLSLAVGVHAFGQFGPFTPLAIDPPDPTSNDPVTLILQKIVGCDPAPTVVRSGFDITVVNPADGIPCGRPPVLATFDFELGNLPAGHYNVSVTDRGTPTGDKLSFDVLAATSDAVVSQSVGSTAGGTEVIVTVAAAHCINHPITACPPPSIAFDGVPATNVVVIDQSHFRATTPPHAAGAVNVVVTDASFTKSSYAFRYYDPMTPPSAKFFERILIPVIFNGPGAFGSQWVTELSLIDTSGFTMEPWRPIAGLAAIPSSKAIVFGSGDAPNGLFLVVPRQVSPALTLHAAVRDTSRGDREWATEIPVVRESRFSSTPIQLLDIPIDPHFRTMLRVYSPTFDPSGSLRVHITIYALDTGFVIRSTFLTLANAPGCSDALSCAEHPSFAALPDLTSNLQPGRARIQLEAFVPIWAFATVTNNETQHVTVVSPQ
jgi:hypothetical protein